jgi:hypothetical protein
MNWKRDSSELWAIWPYPIRENAVKLDVEARLDGGAASLEDFHKTNWSPGTDAGLVDAKAVWDIYLLDVSWTEVIVRCSFVVDDPAGLKNGVLPPGHDIPLLFSLLLRCDNTRWRKAVTCPFGSGSGSVDFSLSRTDVAVDLELQPLVVLAASPTTATAGWASRKVAKVATGFPVYLRLDEPPEGPGRGIEVKWQRFDDSIANALYSLEIVDEQKVRLLLNNRHPALQPVMDSRSKVRNEKTLLRDSLFSFIAGDVWMHLADVASNCVPEEGEESPELYDKILRTLSRRLEMDRDDIKSLFGIDSDTLERAKLHTQLQNYLSVAEKAEDVVLTIPAKVAGGD